MSKNRKLFIFFSAFTICFVIAVVITLNTPFYMENRPEQTEQVEIVAKRIATTTSSGRFGGVYHTPYITFKFSDGTTEELQAGKPNTSALYNHVYEGDTGKLTYKVDKNDGRGRLVSFEKDPEHGGTILEPYRYADRVERVIVYCLSTMTLVMLLFFTFLFGASIWLEKLEKDMFEKKARVKVIGKRRTVYTFEFPDGSVKEIHDPNVSVKTNDTGTLIYKEVENIEKRFKKKKSQWRGRKFVRFKKGK